MYFYLLFSLLLLAGCTTDSGQYAAGQDGSGDKVPDIAAGQSSSYSATDANSSSSAPAIVPPPLDAIPPTSASSINASSSSASITGDEIIVAGAVNRAEKVTVNGEQFTLDNTKINQRGHANKTRTLAVGEMVQLKGEMRDGERYAKHIEVEPTATGPIEFLTSADKSFDILGQTVFTSADTVYSDDLTHGYDSLVEFHHYEVSGWISTEGFIKATRIATPDEQSATVALRGIIKQFSAASKLFHIGRMQVNYANLKPAPYLINGREVIVYGKENTDEVGGHLLAQKIIFKNNKAMPLSQESISLTGPAIAPTANRFFVQGVAIHHSGTTNWTHGGKEHIHTTPILKISGTRRVNGSIDAQTIQYLPSAEDELTGYITQIDAPQNKGQPIQLHTAHFAIQVHGDAIMPSTLERLLSTPNNTDLIGKKIQLGGTRNGRQFKASSLQLLEDDSGATIINMTLPIYELEMHTYTLRNSDFMVRVREHGVFFDGKGNKQNISSIFTRMNEKIQKYNQLNVRIRGELYGSEVIVLELKIIE